ncbi:MAG: FtsQ-type POTRA domain-containing protein [Selenomonadaceae bacterium]|nr:FtsQ-type POTRA domain-containing protein [Selenomonadaceae bacterium]
MKKRNIRPGVLLLIAVAAMLLIFVYSPIFTLREIRASGMTNLTNEDIVQICGVTYGAPLFSLETDEISKRLLSDLRVEEAVVRRSLPSYLDIHITERVPVVTVAKDNHYYAVDKQGLVIDAYSAPKFGQIPNINGVYLENIFIGDKIADENLKKILSFLSALNYEYLKELSELKFTDDTIIGKTTAGVVIRLGDLSNVELKAHLTENFLEDVKRNPINAEYVDFKYDAPFIKMKEEIE